MLPLLSPAFARDPSGCDSVLPACVNSRLVHLSAYREVSRNTDGENIPPEEWISPLNGEFARSRQRRSPLSALFPSL